ncbi:MAG: CehA/McbA family metallohydrolase [Armatimonadetes bacterium]|nr:CehA/McbA family metallohydrolase [Armatimonadota bacterium]
MPDYQPLDLTSFYNAGPEVYGENGRSPVGKQLFHGLPFSIGEGPSFIAFGPGLSEGPVEIPVGCAARTLIFAHALLESEIEAGGPVGAEVASYTVRYEDGEAAALPVRERFEIGHWPQGWGQGPFLAWPDRKNGLHDRYQGHWWATGFRQTEVAQGWPQGYFLWPWRNPSPEKPIRSIVVKPVSGQKFVLAAVTLGHPAEDPFVRTPAREVLLTLPQSEDAEKRFSLAVEVDRGVATYPYLLPETGTESFLEDAFAGWGQTANRKSSPAYVEIAAIPSATVSVRQGEEELGRVGWADLQEKRTVEPSPRLKVEVLPEGRNWVHTTVLDEDTGQPIPCRVHFRSVRGIPYAPHGHHAHINSDMGTWHIDVGGDLRLGQTTYAYIDGRCQGWLPRGEIIVDVARGFEYKPLRAKVTIQPGQRELVLKLKRWANLNEERYFSGDTHVHFLSTRGSHLEASGEDLNVVNLLQSQWGHLFTNTEEFTGEPSVSGDGRTIVYASQENRQHILGHMILLGLKEPVMPWCSDGPDEAEMAGTMETTLSHWADACHRQGGTVVIPHFPNPNCEPAALIATGRVDALEMAAWHGDYNHIEYYRYLNGGYRIPLVGGTDKMTSEVPVGLSRTYVYIPEGEPFTYNNWCKYLKLGNTFVSAGPILRFTVDGQPIGSTHRLSGPGTVEVEASVKSIFPVHTLEIVQQGRVIASTQEASGSREMRLTTTLRVEGNTWLAARCGGPGYRPVPHHDEWARGVMAHSSPVYIAVGGDYRLFDTATAQYMLTLLDGGLSYIRQRATHSAPGTALHPHGEEDHRSYLERPFHEAIAAVHRKMHEAGVAH